MNWLITGGCGFIGLSLLSRLITDKSNNIRIIDNLTNGTREDLSLICNYVEIKDLNNIQSCFEGVEFIEGDILDENLAYKVTKNVDVVIHLAANTGVGPSVESPRLDCYANVIGLFNYIDSARLNSVSRFIFASSGAPAGEVDPPIHEELPPHPVSPYGASKLSGEAYCSAYFRTYGLETVVLRFGNVYGPGSVKKNSVVAKFIKRAIKEETLEIFGDGLQTRDFIYIDDLVDAIMQSVKVANIGGEVFQIASGMETTLEEMTNSLVNVMKKEGIKNIKVKKIGARLGDVKRNYSDTSKAKNLLLWRPKIDQNEGLSKTVKYFLNDIL